MPPGAVLKVSLQSFHHLPRLFVHFPGNLNPQGQNLVPPAASVQKGDPALRDSDLVPRLSSGEDLHPMDTLDSGHLDFRSQCRLPNRQGNFQVKVIPFSLEIGVPLHADLGYQVPVRPAVLPRVALLGQDQPAMVVNPRRDLKPKRLLPPDPSPAGTARAIPYEDLSPPPAPVAFPGHGSGGKADLNLPGSSALPAELLGASPVDPSSLAGGTGNFLKDLNLFFSPPDGPLQADLQG